MQLISTGLLGEMINSTRAVEPGYTIRSERLPAGASAEAGDDEAEQEEEAEAPIEAPVRRAAAP